MNKERLLNVAKALRESPKPEQFDMSCFGHECGTPGCALGHYAMRPDLQSEFTMKKEFPPRSSFPFPILALANHPERSWISPAAPEVLEHFDIDHDEAQLLFDEYGCGGAQRAVDAASFIERYTRGELTHGELEREHLRDDWNDETEC